MRTAAIIKLICWIVIALLLVGVLIWGLGYGSLNDLFRINNVLHFSLSDDADHVAAAGESGEISSTGSYSVSADGIKDITVSWISGSVTVTPYEGTDIRFTETGDRTITDELALKYSLSGDRLNISYFSESTINFSRNIVKKLELLIPASLASSMGELDVGAISAGVEISGVLADEIEVTTTSGRIKLGGCTASDISMTTASGELTAADCICSRLSSDAVSASLDYRGSATKADINTVSGSVDLDFAAAPDEMSIDTISGSVSILIPDNAGFRIKVDRVSGDVNCEFPTVTENSYRVYGDGSAVYTVDTVSGSISIHKAN